MNIKKNDNKHVVLSILDIPESFLIEHKFKNTKEFPNKTKITDRKFPIRCSDTEENIKTKLTPTNKAVICEEKKNCKQMTQCDPVTDEIPHPLASSHVWECNVDYS